MCGKTFKILRKQSGLTIDDACQDICSHATLSRWENGKNCMPFDKVILLLQRIDITIEEFVKACGLPPTNKSIKNVQIFYLHRDLPKLKEAVNKACEIYLYTNHSSKYYLRVAAIAANYYLFLTDKNILPLELQEEFLAYISQIIYSNKSQIDLFAQTTFLFNSEQSYKVCRKLLAKVQTIDSDSLTYRSIIIACINTLAKIVVTSPILAKELLSRLNKIEIPQLYSFLTINLNFFNKVIDYYRTGNDTDALKILYSLVDVGLNNEAKYLLNILKKAEKIHAQ